MTENNMKIPSNAVQLNLAWYEFMGIFRPEYGLRKNFDNLQKAEPNETQEETDRRILRTAIKSKNLQMDFLAEIRNGNFRVFGRDVKNQIHGPVVDLPNSLFEEANPSFKIEWEFNSITVHGRKIIDICVVPKFDQKIAPDSRKKMGRPKAQGLEDAIQELRTDPDFVQLTRNVQCDRVREYLLGDDVNHSKPPKGYRDGAIKIRLRKILPS